MAGARVEITRNTASPALKGMVASLTGAGREQLFAQWGEYLLRSTRERSLLEVGPGGERWPALSPRYARKKAKQRPGKKMLHFDEHMLGDRLSYDPGGDALRVGTSALYGAMQQFGPKPRPWLGLSAADDEELLAITEEHVAGAATAE